MHCLKSLLLILALISTGCTTMMAREVNRDREKHGACSPPAQSRCIDVLKTAVADIATAAKVADEILEQVPRKSEPTNIETGNVQCEPEEEKICSVSFGCECRPVAIGAETP